MFVVHLDNGIFENFSTGNPLTRTPFVGNSYRQTTGRGEGVERVFKEVVVVVVTRTQVFRESPSSILLRNIVTPVPTLSIILGPTPGPLTDPRPLVCLRNDNKSFLTSKTSFV